MFGDASADSRGSDGWDVFGCNESDCFGAGYFDCDVDGLPGFGEDIDSFIGTRMREARSNAGADSAEMTLAIRAHPMYTRLVEAYYECRKIGADDNDAIALEHEKNAMLYSVQVMSEGNDDAMMALDVSRGDVDDFMQECTHEVETYVKELHTLYEDAKACCQNLENRAHRMRADIEKITQPRRNDAAESERLAPATEDEVEAASDDFDQILSTEQQRRYHEEKLRQDLKRKYSSSIMMLKSEFMRKRKKGKLPDTSTDVLKQWWYDNIVWPYPSEDEKRVLICKTKLDATQVNNWFINFRKRHWIQLFDELSPPKNAQEAEEALRKAFNGSLEKAKAYARSL